MKLSGKTNTELVVIREVICSDLKNQQKGKLFLYTASARKKLDKIDRAITANIRENRINAGKPINDSGYSGRQTNRR